MPSVRYYDYGVMRRESDQRMLDAQRRSGNQSMPMRRVTPDCSAQTRPAEGSLPIREQDACTCEKCNDKDTSYECCCAAEHVQDECPAVPRQSDAKPPERLRSEELLIAALLMLAISEGCGLPLILTLLYLLM